MAHICEVDAPEKSDVVVAIVPYRGAADLLVCKVDVAGVAKANDELWFFVDRYRTGVTRVYFTQHRNDAELLVCYVPYRGAAGWKRPHELKGTF